MDKRFLAICLALLFFGSAQAATLTGDFSLETDCAVPAKTAYVLQNNSGATQAYSIRATGENSDWINLNGVWIGKTPLEITLRDKESEELYAFVKPQSCYVQPGDYTVQIAVSNGGTTLLEKIAIRVVESRIMKLAIVPEKREISQCGTAEFEVRVKNTGSRNEIVALSIEGLPQEQAKLAFTETFLAKGEEKNIELEIRPPCNAAAGEHVFSIKAELRGTSFFAMKNAVFEVKDKQGLQMKGAQLEACAEKATQGKLAIKNTGALEDRLSLSIEGIPWARVSPTELVLASGQEKEVSVEFLKTDAAEGTHNFALKAHSAKFGKDTEKELSVNLKECYNVYIAEMKMNGSTGDNAKACVESSTVYTLSVKNEAIEAIKAQISVFGIDAVVSPVQPLSIESGGTKEARVEIMLLEEELGRKVFTAEIKGENFYVSREVEFEAEDCYNLWVGWDGLDREIELDANCKSEPFTIRALNKGTRAQSLRVSVQGPEWVYFEPEQAVIQPGQEQEIYLYFAPPYDTKEGIHQARIFVSGKETPLEKDVNMVVYGGLYAALGTASIEAGADVQELIEKTERAIKASVQLSNDSNSVIRVLGVSLKDFNALFDFGEKLLQPSETITVPMTLYIGESNERQFPVTIRISTDKGDIEREIIVDLDKKEQESPVVGLFSLENAPDLLLAAVVIVVIAAFAFIALKSETGHKPESGLTHLVKDVQDIPGKKLEQIGKRRKTKAGKRTGAGRNLQDIVDEVKRKHVSKKPAKKKK